MKRFLPRARKVLLALEMSNAAGRQQLVGIFRFLGAGIEWDVRINQPATELTAASARMVLQNRFDGIITALPCAESVRARLARANIPTVLLDIPYDGFPRATTSRLDIDDMEIAENAARYFIQQNRFADFAFVGNDDGENWLKRRRQAFRRALLRLGHTAKYLGGSTPTEGGTHVAALAQGLAALAKPAAVFCANDTYAVHTLDACRRAGLAVPDQIAILGVDDDEYICNLSRPPLSSIRPDYENQGFQAANELARLMDGRHRGRIRRIALPSAVTERASTRQIPSKKALVNRAKDFIKLNARHPISVGDVVVHLGVSRRLADLRFREVENRSIHETITFYRLAHVKRLLRETQLSIGQITHLCRFTRAATLKELFLKKERMSMRAYRSSVQAAGKTGPGQRPKGP